MEKVSYTKQGQNFIGTVDSALGKKFTKCLKVFRKLSRNSEGGFMKQTVLYTAQRLGQRNPTSVGDVLHFHCDWLREIAALLQKQ